MLLRTSKKRKRDGVVVRRDLASVADKGNVESSYRDICDIVAALQVPMEDNDNGYACEHLKMALRASPDQAAEIVGISLTIANHLLCNALEPGVPSHAEGRRLPLHCWLKIWKARSSRAANTSAEVRCTHQPCSGVQELT